MPLSQQTKVRLVVIFIIVIMVLPVCYGVIRQYFFSNTPAQTVAPATTPAK